MIWTATDLLTDQDGMCLGMEMDNSDYLLEMNNLIQTEMGRHFDEVPSLTHIVLRLTPLLEQADAENGAPAENDMMVIILRLTKRMLI